MENFIKHIFLVYFVKNKTMKNFEFFDQNDGPPLCNFFDFV